MSRILIAACAIAGAAFILTPQARADASDPAGDLAHAWDHVQFELTDRDQRLQGFSDLADRADHMLQTSPDNAEVMVWEAISLSSEAGEIRGPSALGKVKKARDLLLAAEQIDPNTLGDGSIYSSLGTLYYQVPPFPIGFGNKKKARVFLEKALEQNPDGIDPNYFYAEFLYDEDDHAGALQYLEKALKAPPRPGRASADEGRHQDIQKLMTKVRKELTS